MADAAWWYELEGRQAGPVSEAALVELLRSGQLAPGARVWRAGMAGWAPARSLAELAGAMAGPPALTTNSNPSSNSTSNPNPNSNSNSISNSNSNSNPTSTSNPNPNPDPNPNTSSAAPPGPRDPPAGRGERGLESTSPSTAYALPPGMEPVSLGALLGLGLVTLGIYPAVKFYQAVGAYQALAGRPSRFTTWFWLAVALSLLGGPAYLLGGLAGALAHVAGLAFTILALFEALALRADATRRWGVAPAMTSDATHKALFVVGLVTAWLLVGLVLLVVQAVKFFDDHRALGDALRARPAAPRAA